MAIQRGWWILAGAALGAALAGFWLARELDRSGPELASGTWLPRPKAIADFQLTDPRGQSFGVANLQGTRSLVFFGFTHCPDVCPTTLAQLARLARGAPITPLQVLFVSIDPERDSPEVVGRYARAFDPSFIGLTGEPANVRRVAQEFGVAVSRVDLPGGDYTMDHSAVLFLLDARAQVVAVFSPPFDPQRLTSDLHRAAGYLRNR